MNLRIKSRGGSAGTIRRTASMPHMPARSPLAPTRGPLTFKPFQGINQAVKTTAPQTIPGAAQVFAPAQTQTQTQKDWAALAALSPAQQKALVDQTNLRKLAALTPAQQQALVDQQNLRTLSTLSPAQQQLAQLAQLTPAQQQALVDQTNLRKLAALPPDQLAAVKAIAAAQQAAQALQAGLDVLLERLECSDPWAVVIVPHMSARMSVVPLRREVRVSRAASFLTAEVSRLAVHEIATHVARSVAGYAHVHPMLAIGLHPHHLHDEEGLAVWVEGELGVSSDESLRTYLLRALAVQCALEGSYLDTYALMRKYTSAEQAAAITLRVKRGIASTSAPGAFTKDHVYLTGSAAVSKYLASDRSGLAALFSGKVSLGMLGLFEQLRRASLASLSPIDPLEMALSVRVAASEQLCAS